MSRSNEVGKDACVAVKPAAYEPEKRPRSRGQSSYIPSSCGEFWSSPPIPAPLCCIRKGRGPSSATRCARDNNSRIFSPAGAWSIRARTAPDRTSCGAAARAQNRAQTGARPRRLKGFASSLRCEARRPQNQRRPAALPRARAAGEAAPRERDRAREQKRACAFAHMREQRRKTLSNGARQRRFRRTSEDDQIVSQPQQGSRERRRNPARA